MTNLPEDSPSPNEEVSRILEKLDAALGESDPQTLSELMPLLYRELHQMASRMMHRERAQHTLQATALVNEAYLRLVGSTELQGKGRAHFMEAAAGAMRRILVDHAREVGAQKRGGGWNRVTLHETPENETAQELDVIALVQALEQLEALDPRQAKIVELRFFTGLSGQEIADHIGVSRNTVVRELTMARAWLQRAMEGGSAESS